SIRSVHAREETPARLLCPSPSLARSRRRLEQCLRERRRVGDRIRLHLRPGAARASFSRRASRRAREAPRISRHRIAGVLRAKPQLPDEVEDYRDQRWCREGTRQIQTALDAEQFVEQIGFTACLTDSRRPGPSLYVAVCGRRDAVLPRNVQKDEEA